VVRKGQTSSVSVVPEVDVRTSAPSDDPGLTLRPLPRVGSEVVRVTPGGPAARAGLRPGDVVVHVGDLAAPAPAQVARAFAAADPAQAILFGLERGGRRLAVAVVKE
jgi:S1-C subfamily serine protease